MDGKDPAGAPGRDTADEPTKAKTPAGGRTRARRRTGEALEGPQGQERVAEPTVPAPVEEPSPPERPPQAEQPHERSATFSLRLLLEDDQVHSTSVVHHLADLTEVKDQWSGWDPARLVEFIQRQTRLGQEQEPAATATTPATAGQPTDLRLREVRAVPMAVGQPRTIVDADQPFVVRLTLDLEGEGGALENAGFMATVFAKRLGGGSRQRLGEAQGHLGRDASTIEIPTDGLPAGSYRLEAAVQVGDEPSRGMPGSAAVVEGTVVHVA
jgi:hypothetical protein